MKTQTKTQLCPTCLMEKQSWTGNQGSGYAKGSKIYCCQGCADGRECTCSKNPPSMEVESD